MQGAPISKLPERQIPKFLEFWHSGILELWNALRLKFGFCRSSKQVAAAETAETAEIAEIAEIAVVVVVVIIVVMAAVVVVVVVVLAMAREHSW